MGEKNFLLNEGYSKGSNLITSGCGSKVLINNINYHDLSFCAGSLLLGHSHKIFKKFLSEIIKKNISNVATKNLHAVNLSRTLKNIFPKYSNFIYCNSGTESVFKSLRIARAISKKNLIISVSGSWHGSVSELLFQPTKSLKNIELSGGLKLFDKKNLKFIPYNNIKTSKKILDKNKKNIMTIIIEPIQGCLPYNAQNYLKFLNNYAKKNNIILIFDEMITGLRVNCSSVASEMNLSPDIITFGKCFGGGNPMGIIAIKKNIFKKIKKFKSKKKIFFGGTFSGNSINTFISNNIVKFIYQNKKKIFKDLENKSNYLQTKLNSYLEENKFDIKIYRFYSMLRIVFSCKNIDNITQRKFLEKNKLKKIDHFINYLFKQKIYYPSNGLIFLSLQTSYKDLDYLIKKIKIGFKKFF